MWALALVSALESDLALALVLVLGQVLVPDQEDEHPCLDYRNLLALQYQQ